MGRKIEVLWGVHWESPRTRTSLSQLSKKAWEDVLRVRPEDYRALSTKDKHLLFC